MKTKLNYSQRMLILELVVVNWFSISHEARVMNSCQFWDLQMFLYTYWHRYILTSVDNSFYIIWLFLNSWMAHLPWNIIIVPYINNNSKSTLSDSSLPIWYIFRVTEFSNFLSLTQITQRNLRPIYLVLLRIFSSVSHRCLKTQNPNLESSFFPSPPLCHPERSLP